MKIKKIIAISLIVMTLFVFSSCGKSNKLTGVWEKTSGHFETTGWTDYCLIEEDDIGTLEFTKDGMYICDGSDGTSSGTYTIVSDTVLIIDSTGYSNTITYSIKGRTLTISNDYGTCTFKKK